ncbi:MAG: hypothetical protein ABSG32_24875 [Terriglobia bacterium]|jgi:hypothetical protein
MEKSITPIEAPVGVDVHKRRCKVVEFDHGEIKVRKPMANTREEWLDMLSELPPNAEIGLEVSTAGYFAMSKRSADLFCRSAAFPCPWGENRGPAKQVRATLAFPRRHIVGSNTG